MALKIPQVRKQLEAAVRAGNHERARKLELTLIAREAMNPAALQPVIDAAKATEERLRLAAEDDADRATFRAIIKEANRTLRERWIESLRQMVARVRRTATETMDGLMTLPQKRAATGLQIDRTGRVKPAPGPMPRTIMDDSLPLGQILEVASSLLHLNGDADLETRAPAIEAVVGTEQTAVSRLMRARLGGSEPWTKRLGRNLIDPTEAVSGLVRRRRTEAAGSSVKKFIRSMLGLRDRSPRKRERFAEPEEPVTGVRGLVRRLQNLLRHESLKAYGAERDFQRTVVSDAVLVGYVLYSVFDEATAPDHAARDGSRFYKDNRPGSYLPWSRRIVPPYRVNCLCFTADIFETPQGFEYTADWQAVPRIRGVRELQPTDVGREVWSEEAGGFVKVRPDMVGTRVGREREVELSPRDVGTWAEWFDLQRPAIQRKLMGDRRYWAMAPRRDDGRTRYVDYIDPDGRILSANRLENESDQARMRRIEAAEQVMQQVGENIRQSLKQHGNKWVLSRDEELFAKRRLRRFLSQLDWSV